MDSKSSVYSNQYFDDIDELEDFDNACDNCHNDDMLSHYSENDDKAAINDANSEALGMLPSKVKLVQNCKNRKV